MAIELIPSANEENAGSYAGLIASAFMIGRSLTSYHWGKFADVYGRVAVLQLSLGMSAVFALLFGLAPTFGWALCWRFLLGLGNGLISTVKTLVSEIANGDKEYETRTMNLVMSMWGGAFLIAPAISGALAEPVKQYPSVAWLQEGGFSSMLSAVPFFLPNLVGGLFCIISMVFVHLFVVETLPDHKMRHPRHIPDDMMASVRGIYEIVLPRAPDNEEATPILPSKPPPSYTGTNETKDDYDSDIELPPEILHFIKEDVEDAIRESQLLSDDIASVINTNAARHSLVSGISKRSSVAIESRRASRVSNASDLSLPPATIASLWAQKSIRLHCSIYWIASFAMVAIDEGFPLFCISLAYGLGLSEYTIGNIMSASGVIFFIIQLTCYSPFVARMGLYGSLKFALVAEVPLCALIPLSVWLNRDSSGYDEINWTAFTFLAIVMGLSRVFMLTFFSGITVAINRLVEPSHRATLNGLNTLGGSIAKGIGPTFAGLLVAFFFSSGWFAPAYGAWLLFGTVAVLGVMTSVLGFLYLKEDYEDASIQLTV